ncbi:hypothetical protein NPIL_35511 [Nephila pilipes]|uniref:Telomerase RNA component interacting RNase n=1 Tax=Nephila pilipes TaxID=299642 RepID=A0A8X6Q2A7_NEPPI|nr:hypothetical protein NPIL_35511 [Nephila pilipes]
MSSHHRRSRSSRHVSEPSLENQDSNSNNSTGIINIITSKKQGINTFANDGSFLELFKKKMEEEAKGETSGTSDGEGSKSADEKLKKLESSVKRRGNKVLKTGMVKKQKTEDPDEEPPPQSDAWTRYMAEVKKYRQQACDEDGKTRPLVK